MAAPRNSSQTEPPWGTAGRGNRFVYQQAPRQQSLPPSWPSTAFQVWGSVTGSPGWLRAASGPTSSRINLQSSFHRTQVLMTFILSFP